MKTSDLYKENGGAAYHSHKHLEKERTVALVSKFRAKKFRTFISADDKILEYGVGAGWNLHNINCAEKLGYDVSTMLKPMLDKYAINFTTDSSSIPKGYFDVVICHHVLEHVPNPLETLRELKTYLKTEGKLLLFVPADVGRRFNKYDPDDEDHHLFNWNVQSLCTLALESGFSIIEYKRKLYGFDRFVSSFIDKLSLPDFFFYPIFYFLNIIQPHREIILICKKDPQLSGT